MAAARWPKIEVNEHEGSRSCHCGAIAWEGEVDPAKVTVCHCGDCQRFSGAAFRASVPSKAEDFAILRGEPVRYVKTAE